MDAATEKIIRDQLEAIVRKNEEPLLACNNVERTLLAFIVQHIKNEVAQFASARTIDHQQANDDKFRLDKRWFTFALQEDREGAALTIQIRSVDRHDNRRRSVCTAQFKSCGRFTKVTVSGAPNLKELCERIASSSAGLMDYGYRWLEERLLLILSNKREEVATALYGHLRRVVPSKMALYVWFLAIVNGAAVSIADATNIHAAIRRAEKRKLMVKEAPLELIGELLSARFSFETTVSRDAIATGRVIDIDLVQVRYSNTGLQVCEESIYDTKGLTVQPIVTDGKSLLTVVYPTSIRGHVEHRIEIEKDEFKRILDLQHSRVLQLMDRIERLGRSSHAYSEAVHYAGRFLGGLFGVPQV